MRKIRLRSGKEVVVKDRNMGKERASNSSTSTDDSAATDKTQPSPSRATITPLNASASGWVPPQPPPTGRWIPTQTGTSWGPQPSWAPPQNTTPSTWPIVPPSTQQTPQGWYPPPQGGVYGYSNSPQFGIYGAGSTPPSFGVYNPQGINNTPQLSLAQPSAQSIPVPQPTQVATAVTSTPQVVSIGNNNRSIFPEMFRQMPISSTPTNNTIESLVFFRQQIKESHHDLVHMLTQ
ncbi:hypothetical protein PIB30_046433 [Stylosanthes scabra]|uniref:Uncharacterized protein n=1 Tax=Stylosanthes scabra TaxID=79078 RepID=A0ABU6XEI0_9FABA|nr:hypothetical protein [Stylosanthes scabra]